MKLLKHVVLVFTTIILSPLIGAGFAWRMITMAFFQGCIFAAKFRDAILN